MASIRKGLATLFYWPGRQLETANNDYVAIIQMLINK